MNCYVNVLFYVFYIFDIIKDRFMLSSFENEKQTDTINMYNEMEKMGLTF